MGEQLRCELCETVIDADGFVLCEECAGTFCKKCADETSSLCGDCDATEYPEGM